MGQFYSATIIFAFNADKGQFYSATIICAFNEDKGQFYSAKIIFACNVGKEKFKFVSLSSDYSLKHLTKLSVPHEVSQSTNGPSYSLKYLLTSNSKTPFS